MTTQMAQMPDRLKTSLEVTLTVIRPGDVLILGISPEQLRRVSEAEVHEMEEMTMQRLPKLADCLVVPADVLAVYREGKDDGTDRDDRSPEGG